MALLNIPRPAAAAERCSTCVQLLNNTLHAVCMTFHSLLALTTRPAYPFVRLRTARQTDQLSQRVLCPSCLEASCVSTQSPSAAFYRTDIGPTEAACEPSRLDRTRVHSRERLAAGVRI